jgi:hypothetical protein
MITEKESCTIIVSALSHTYHSEKCVRLMRAMTLETTSL